MSLTAATADWHSYQSKVYMRTRGCGVQWTVVRATPWLLKKQLSAEVQYILPTNYACRIVTHARAILTGRVYASLYCSFTPLSPTVYTAQW